MKLYKFNNLINKDRVVELKIEGTTVYVGGWSDKPQVLDGYLVVNIIADDNMIIRKIKKALLIFRVKWVKGECRHLCLLCKYRNECYDNLEL